MGQYYQKINTLYYRDEKTGLIQPEKGYVQPEFTLLKDIKWEATEKVDGTNMSVHIIPAKDGNFSVEIHGKTEKANIPVHLLKRMNELFTVEKIREAFGEVENTIILFGEGYGVKIQGAGGNYFTDKCDFILFDVKIGSWWLKREDCESVASKFGIDTVPIIGEMTIPEAEEIVKRGFKSKVAKANPDFEAEGLVLRAPLGLRARNGERLIVKVKTCDWRKYENSKIV